MNILALSAILALFAVESCSKSAPIKARQATVAVFVLSGLSSTEPFYPNFTISIPEDGVTVPITNPLIVYSLAPLEAFTNHGYYYPQANCTFTLEDGTKAYVTGTQDITPQKVTSVSCVAAQYPGINTSIVPSGLYPSPTTPGLTSANTSSAAVGTVSSLVPPYPTTTGPFFVPGTTGASGSAAPSATGVRTGGKRAVPLHGGARRATRYFNVSLVALLGFVAAL